MCLGREVQSSFILFFCIAVLVGGASAFGTEFASVVCACADGEACAASCLCLHSLDGIHSWAFSSERRWRTSSGMDYSCASMSAMAIPDGPGAVCLSVLGFLGVSVMKNRRTWIGLCLSVLTSGRAGAALLSKVNVTRPERDWPGLGGKSDTECAGADISSRRAYRPPTPLCLYRLCILGPEEGRLFSAVLRDQKSVKGVLAQGDAASIRLQETDRDDFGRAVFVRSMFVKCTQWARPPPCRS